MSREDYWWIVANDPDTGKLFLIAGGRNEDECRQKGFEMLPGTDFKIKMLPTRNLQRASALLKGNRLEETKNLHQASQRIGHEKSVKSWLEQRREARLARYGR